MIAVWCAIMISGTPTHLRGTLLEYNYKYDYRNRMTEKMVLVDFGDSAQYINENNCLYTDPKEKEKDAETI